MSYVLSPEVKQQIVSLDGADPDIARIDAKIHADHYGDNALYFQVLLRDGFVFDPPSAEIGRRLLEITAYLRRRAVGAGVPIFSFVNFAHENEAAA